MAACLASRGFEVVGVDVSQAAVDALNAGRAPAQESGLDALVAENRKKLRATIDHADAVLNSDLSFVIVPTPSDSRGSFSLQYAAFAFEAIGKALAQKATYHTVVLTSTVLPGSTRQVLLPILERASGKKCGVDFGLCYSPEFIALGTVIRDFLNPDFHLVGEFDDRSGDSLEQVNRRTALNEAPSMRMSLENAELAKVAVNTFVTLKISYANMLADFCERIPGGDVDMVSNAIGLDKRIGRRYLTGGFGYGGPCFPRDNVALNYIGEQLGASCEILRVNDAFNRTISARYVHKLRHLVRRGATVAVLGLSYKPLSHVVEESPGIYLCRALADHGLRVIGFDPLAAAGARQELKGVVIVASDLPSALADAEMVLVTTVDDCFLSLRPEDFVAGKDRVIVVDFWRALSPAVREHERIEYIPMGQCLDDEAASLRMAHLWGDHAVLEHPAAESSE